VALWCSETTYFPCADLLKARRLMLTEILDLEAGVQITGSLPNLTVSLARAMNVLDTAVVHASGNQMHSASDTSYAWLLVR
jgi:hypothetical protein